MKQLLVATTILFAIAASVAFTEQADNLRQLYSRPISQWPAPAIDPGIAWKEWAALPKPTAKTRALQRDPQVILGKTLFFDPRLSASNQVSCATCHDPGLSWTDGRAISVGHDQLTGKRNAPSILNVGSQKLFFWDGRARSLQQQAINPISTPHEMAMDLTKLIPKIRSIKGYLPLFHSAYGSEEVTMEGILDAIAAFEETVVSRPGRFDEFVRGKYQSLSDEEIAGLHLFRTKGRCMNCHNGPYFTDQQFHNIGLVPSGSGNDDLGRYELTGKPEDIGRFRTPSLRDVMRTGPWMHDGRFESMGEVINFFNNGGEGIQSLPTQGHDSLQGKKDPLIRKLGLSAAEQKAIVAFLNAITAEPIKVEKPVLPD